MALNNNFVSFQTILESVYNRVGYQQIDWASAIEAIGDTIKLIGEYPAFKTVTTNGLNGAPNPLEITDYRVALPAALISLKAIRKLILSEEPVDGGTDLQIAGYEPMVEATDMFFQSIREQWDTEIAAGTYDYTTFKQVETVTLSGTSGTATISATGGLTKTVTFDTDLTTTASNFVTTNAADYLAEGVVLTSSGADLIFTAQTSGVEFTQPTIVNATGDLIGTVTASTSNTPVQVYGPEYRLNTEYQKEFKIDNGYIYTNFETGFVELVYTAWVTDDHGFPMVPDDQRYIEAIKWTLIEHIDFKKLRLGEINERIYNISLREKNWYIASAKSKARIPSVAKMESMKEAFLRSITKTTAYDNYFKTMNMGERRHTHNSRTYPPRNNSVRKW